MGDANKVGTLTLRGGAAPKKVASRRSDWTAAMAATFVETIAETCNITFAAKAIGRSIAMSIAGD